MRSERSGPLLTNVESFSLFREAYKLEFSFIFANMKTAIIGAGAAGCFAAIQIKRNKPEAEVTVYEAGVKPLAKVAVTGGGRCNLTNSFEGLRSLDEAYPRGARLMKRLFNDFDYNSAYQWFEHEGISLTTQDDNCVFPVSQDAMEIVNTLLRLMRTLGVRIMTRHRVTAVAGNAADGSFRLSFATHGDAVADAVIVTTGGRSKHAGYGFLSPLNVEIVEPVPSLFSLCLENGHPLTTMTGTVVEDVSVKLKGCKTAGHGPLLITHWGISGPAVLKLSSYAARILYGADYKTAVSINWFGEAGEKEVADEILSIATENAHKQLSSAWPKRFNNRLWRYFLDVCQLRTDMRWGELGKKGLNRLVATLTNQTLDIKGKNRYKDEFVTCGGVALTSICPSTLESKKHKRLYFAGEVLDVDAITGGFNLQAAWTMGYVVARQFT